jgi:hypothetical protein
MSGRWFVLVIFSVLLTSRCATFALEYCSLDQSTIDAVTVVQQSWDSLDPDRVAEIWPASLSWGSRADAVAPCSGTTTFSYLGSVADNQCRCCDVLLFTDIRNGNECSQQLSSLTIVRSTQRYDEAQRLGVQFLKIVSGEEPTLLNSVATRVKEIAPQKQQVSSVAIKQVGKAWEVRLMIYRVHFDK